jgi:UDP-N-acetylmuramyl tripeptide synthase
MAGGPDGMTLTMALPEGEISLATPLTGLYNAYNLVAAAAAAAAIGIRKPAIEQGLASFTAAFGRQERLTVAGREVQVILAKNPAGLNQVLRTITCADVEERDLVFFLNDDIADGRDISWIWDVDFELLAGRTRAVTASGHRAWDMALRLKYAGLEPVLRVEAETSEALASALRGTPEGQTLYVIPTYTAMLSVREILARQAGRGAFWEEARDG